MQVLKCEFKGERAILFDKAFGGISDKVKGEGMHFYIPFM
jgi:hypothetical protein